MRSHPTVADVRAEIRRGGLLDARIDHATLHVDGYCDHESGIICVDAYPSIALVILHEALHRMHPRWGEKRVERESRYVLQHMPSTDVRALVREWRALARQWSAPVTLLS